MHINILRCEYVKYILASSLVNRYVHLLMIKTVCVNLSTLNRCRVRSKDERYTVRVENELLRQSIKQTLTEMKLIVNHNNSDWMLYTNLYHACVFTLLKSPVSALI